MKVLIFCHKADNYSAFLVKREPKIKSSRNMIEIQWIELSIIPILKPQLLYLLFWVVFSTTGHTNHSPLFLRPSCILLPLYILYIVHADLCLLLYMPSLLDCEIFEGNVYPIHPFIFCGYSSVPEGKQVISSQTFPKVGGGETRAEEPLDFHQSLEQLLLVTSQSFRNMLSLSTNMESIVVGK